MSYRTVLIIAVAASVALLCGPAQSKPDCAVFVTSYMQRGLPSTLPPDGPATKSLSIFASPGEYEPCTFSVRANEDMQKVSVAVSDLKCGKAVIRGARIVARKADISNYGSGGGKKITAECYLPRFDTVDIPKDTTQRFWLTTYVPESAAAGVYAGRVTLKLDGKPFDTLDLRLEVLPVKLLAPENISFFMYSCGGIMPSFARNVEYQRKVFLDQKAHGMNTTTAYMWLAKRKDGSFDLRLQRNLSDLPAIPQMQLIMDTGLAAPGRPVIWIGTADHGDPKAYEAVYAEAKKRNWPEILLYVVDEPVTKERQDQAVATIAKIDEFRKSHPDMRIRTVTAINGVAIGQIGHIYDIWICYTADASSAIGRAKKLGKEIWAYDCTLAALDAVTSRHCYGFWAWRIGLQGVSNWAYADVPGAYGNKIWDSSKNEGIYCYSFVKPTPAEPVPSVAWEAIREGVDDYRYLTTLKAAIDKAYAAGRNVPALEAERFLDDVKSRFNPDSYTRAYLGGSKTQEGKDADDFIYNRPAPEPDITPGGYNEIRYQIAKWIVKLDAGS